MGTGLSISFPGNWSAIPSSPENGWIWFLLPIAGDVSADGPRRSGLLETMERSRTIPRRDSTRRLAGEADRTDPQGPAS
jgi:hypothetical protein